MGYIANSTEAVNAFKGCRQGTGGDVLRSDMGRDGFPDFIVAGSRAPTMELHTLLDEKSVACAAASPFDDFFSDPKWRTPGAIPLKDQRAYVKDNYARCTREDKYLGAPRFQTNEDLLYSGWAPRRMCETMGPDETRALLLLGNPVENALTVFAGTLENTPEREFNGWIRRSEAAGGGSRREGFKSHSKAPSKAGFSKTSRSLRRLPRRHQRRRTGRGTPRAATTPRSESDPDAHPVRRRRRTKEELEAQGEEEAAWITYDAEGFRKVLDVDLAIAEVCGSDFMLPEDHPEFKAQRRVLRQGCARAGIRAVARLRRRARLRHRQTLRVLGRLPRNFVWNVFSVWNVHVIDTRRRQA